MNENTVDAGLKVSIIIPAYNVEKYIKNCIESILAQSFTNFEAIIVDDGSSDNTLDISQELSLSDSRVKVVHQDNKGLPGARNTGLKIANGDFVMFVDSDDWLEKNCLEKTVSVLKKEHADIVFFDHIREYNRGHEDHHAYSKNKVYQREKENEVFLYDMRTITAWGKLYSRDIIGADLFDETLQTAEDVEFNYRIYGKVNKAVFLTDCLLHYRIQDTSAIHGYNCEIEKKFEKPIRKIRSSLLSHPNTDKLRAYYSFAGIAYIIICRNKIALDPAASISAKVQQLSELSRKKWVKELFSNTKYLYMQKSRKAIILFGKNRMYLTILGAIAIKNHMER